jgi:hypothetical protein
MPFAGAAEFAHAFFWLAAIPLAIGKPLTGGQF